MAKRIPGKKITPVGEPLNWTEADIDRLSQVTEEDKAAANAFWRRQSPRKMKTLLNAKPERKTPRS
jgi:hypothetical protein